MDYSTEGKTCGVVLRTEGRGASKSGDCVIKLGFLLPYIRRIPGVLQLWYGVVPCREKRVCIGNLVYINNIEWTCQ